MPILANGGWIPDSGRQYSIVAVTDITQAALADSDTTLASGSYNVTNTGFALDAVELPENAVVTQIQATVTTAFDSATAATVSIGDSASATRYLGATSVKTAGLVSATPTGYNVTNATNKIRLTFALNGATTAGAIQLHVTYYVKGREQFTQGVKD